MPDDGPLGSPSQKTPGDHAARLHLFDEGQGRRSGVLSWIGRHPAAAVFVLLVVAAPFAWRAIKPSPAPLPAEPAPGGTIASDPAEGEATHFREGLTPLPAAEISAPVNATQGITVRAIDADGVPLTGALVRFAVSEGAGELELDSVRTDGAGLAGTTLHLPALPGRVVVSATLAGSQLPGTSVTVDAMAGAPQRVAIVGGNRQEADAGALLPQALAIRVTDAGGNPVPDVEVRFRVVAGDGVVAPERARTDSLGRASAFWRLGTAPGEQRVAALAPQADGDFLTFLATARTRAAAPAPDADVAPAGTGGSADSTVPTADAPAYIVPQAFAVGGNFVCAIPGGNVSCRGSNDRGQRSTTRGTGFVALAAGLSHACALTSDGEASCWGANESGQLGDGTRTDRESPVSVSTELHFSTVVAGGSHTCALAAGGRAMCWGKNLNGQLGDGSRENRSEPRRTATAETFVRLVAGWSHTCGRSASGSTFCWGLNDRGQLGDGTRVDRLVPTRVPGTFETLVAGSAHTCGIRSGRVYCWGDNGFGQLGDGTTEDRPSPVVVQGLTGTPTRLAAGAVSTCALMEDGSAWCWGQNLHGQLGDGSTQNRSRPVRVTGGHVFRSIFAGGALTCGFAADGLDYCWGLNQSGQLGDGTRTNRSVPTRVGG